MSYPHHWKTLSRHESTHKCRKNSCDPSGHFLYHYTCKNLNISYIFFYYITRSSAVVITSWNPFTQWTSIWNVYSALQQQNNFEFWKMPPATQHDRIAQDYPEKNVSHSFILFHFFFFKGQRQAHVIWVTAQIKVSVQFQVRSSCDTAPFGGSLVFFPLPCTVQLMPVFVLWSQ